MRNPKLLNSVNDISNLYAQDPVRECIPGKSNARRKMPAKETTYQVYTVNSLPVLAKALSNECQEITDDDEYKNLHMIRYVLTEDNILLFAREGADLTKVPPHFMMPAKANEPAYLKESDMRVRCAGNLYFDDDYTQFNEINNKSGCFEPENALFKKMHAVMVALAETQLISFQDSFDIQHQRADDNHRAFTTFTVSFKTMSQYVHQEFNKEELDKIVEDNKAAKHREVHYQPKEFEDQPKRSTICAAKGLKLNFNNLPEDPFLSSYDPTLFSQSILKTEGGVEQYDDEEKWDNIFGEDLDKKGSLTDKSKWLLLTPIKTKRLIKHKAEKKDLENEWDDIFSQDFREKPSPSANHGSLLFSPVKKRPLNDGDESRSSFKKKKMEFTETDNHEKFMDLNAETKKGCLEIEEEYVKFEF